MRGDALEMGALSEQIKKFILENFPLARKGNLTNTDNLLESGAIDSMGILDIVGFLEREFSIAVADDELVPENFQTIDCLTAFVEKKAPRGARGAA